MKKTILLTRPLAASHKWAALLERHGFDCVIEPLLTIAPTRAPRPAGTFQAVLITSSNAPDVLPQGQIADLLSLPCFCVGALTGEAARALGFTNVICGAGDGEALAHLVAATLPEKHKSLLHIAGEITADRMQEILQGKGFMVSPWPVYRAIAAEDFSPRAQTLWAQGIIDIIPVFSPRSARILVALIEKNQLSQACAAITAIGLSQAVANVLEKCPWRRLLIAAKPEESEILKCVQGAHD